MKRFARLVCLTAFGTIILGNITTGPQRGKTMDGAQYSKLISDPASYRLLHLEVFYISPGGEFLNAFVYPDEIQITRMNKAMFLDIQTKNARVSPWRPEWQKDGYDSTPEESSIRALRDKLIALDPFAVAYACDTCRKNEWGFDWSRYQEGREYLSFAVLFWVSEPGISFRITPYFATDLPPPTTDAAKAQQRKLKEFLEFIKDKYISFGTKTFLKKTEFRASGIKEIPGNQNVQQRIELRKRLGME